MSEAQPDATLMGADDNKGQVNPPETPTWMAQLPDDLKTNETLAKFATIGDASRNLVELNGKMEGTVRIPGEDASDEEKSSFYAALGRPETADKYEFTRPTLPESIQYDETQEASFRALAHEIGLSQAQAEKLYGFYHQGVVDSYNQYMEVVKQGREEAETALKKEWGDKFDGNLETARRAMREFGGEDITQFMESSGLGNNPLMVKLFSRIGEAMMEDGIISGDVRQKSEERPRTLSGKPMLDFPSMEKQNE